MSLLRAAWPRDPCVRHFPFCTQQNHPACGRFWAIFSFFSDLMMWEPECPQASGGGTSLNLPLQKPEAKG